MTFGSTRKEISIDTHLEEKRDRDREVDITHRQKLTHRQYSSHRQKQARFV